MGKRDLLAKALAWLGTAMVWLPIVAPILFSLLAVGRSGQWRFDYLMPAELFPVAFIGGVLLLGAAVRTRLFVRPILGAFGAALGLLVGGQIIASLSGLASGRIAPAGIWWVLVLATLAGFVLCLIGLGVLGALLVRDTMRPASPNASQPS
jgi:hypothetical protein